MVELVYVYLMKVSRGTLLISYEDFLTKYNITDKEFQYAEISWEELSAIYDDYSRNEDEYVKVLDGFVDEFFNQSIIRSHKLKIHSLGRRVKNAEHLIDKIVRKKVEKASKYEECNRDNYLKFITDVAGVRILLVYKSDWENVHNYIVGAIENDNKNYIKDSLKDYDDDENHTYIAEEPKVHIRNGDNRDLYEKILPPNRVIDDKIYRSAHYIVKYHGIYVEIQVRTLFEEGWGEVDHSILYPSYKENKIFQEYTELLNRLSGLADEMSSFFLRLESIEKSHEERKEEVTIPAAAIDSKSNDMFMAGDHLKQEDSQIVTYADTIKRAIKGERV